MRAGAIGKGPSETDAGTGPGASVSPAHSANENDEPIDEGDPAAFEIEQEFRRKLMGARQLPGRERAQARRAAHTWRREALKALREQRMLDRKARSVRERQKRLISPSP